MLKRILIFFILPALLLCPAQAAEAERETVALPIVMYHHIAQNSEQWNDYVISPAEFESDLLWLREHGYETVSVAELLAWEAGEFSLPEKACMITFDDGFESTAAYAEPLLKQYGFRGVVAVIGSVCEKFSELDEHDPELSNMSWADAKALAERGVIEVQCHTWDMHALWPRNGCSKKSSESVENYRWLLSRDLSSFLSACRENAVPLTPSIAYPYGAYCRETTEAVRDFGFLAAFTCTEKINRLTGAGEELYDLGRYNRPHGVSSEKFFAKWEENG